MWKGEETFIYLCISYMHCTVCIQVTSVWFLCFFFIYIYIFPKFRSFFFFLIYIYCMMKFVKYKINYLIKFRYHFIYFSTYMYDSSVDRIPFLWFVQMEKVALNSFDIINIIYIS